MVDLRNDTISISIREMLEAILEAKLGDDGRTDSKGGGEDLAINELEGLTVEITRKEVAVLFPSGTQGDTPVTLTYCRPDQRMMVDEMQHIYLSEKVVLDPSIRQPEPTICKLDQDNLPDLDDMRRILKSQEIVLLCIENAHNFLGSTRVSLERMKAIHELVRESGVPVHMDGARMSNAVVALGVGAREMCRYVDSVIFCICFLCTSPSPRDFFFWRR